MNQKKCKYQIVIADGGDSKETETILLDKERFKNLSYFYFKYPYDEDLSYYYKKLNDVLRYIDTKYVIFADNDDFFILDDIDNAINFLEENFDYAGCGGKSYYLNLYDDKLMRTNQANGKKCIISEVISERSIEIDDSRLRIKYFLENVEKYDLYHCWYFVTRTDEVRSILKNVLNYNFKDAVLFELFWFTSLLKRGKLKELSFPYYVRQNGSSELTKLLNERGHIFERFILNDYFSEVYQFISDVYNKTKEGVSDIKKSFLCWFSFHAKSYFYSKNYINIFINRFKLIIVRHYFFAYFISCTMSLLGRKKISADVQRIISPFIR